MHHCVDHLILIIMTVKKVCSFQTFNYITNRNVL